jgi:proteasome alpha subunit
VTLPIYASPEQLMRERSEIARKGIARGRSVVVLKYRDGILFVAENPSSTLHKVSEIYDRIGFAAAGRYNEYEALRRGGIRHVDLWGYSYDRRDVSARQLANVYAQTLGAIFTDQLKPYEVEICVGEVAATAEEDQLYRLTFEGSIFDEPQYLVMGGQTEPILTKLKDTYREDTPLADALRLAVQALKSGAGNGDAGGAAGKLEVAVLERTRLTRAFRRLEGAALSALLPEESAAAEGKDTAKPSSKAPENGESATD